MNDVAKMFLDSGLLGATIVVLAGVIVYLQKKLDKRNDRVKELNQELVALAQANGKEMIEFYKTDAATEKVKADALNKMAQSIDMLRVKIEDQRK